MPQSLSSILIHLVFSTKLREPLITPAIETELQKYMASVLEPGIHHRWQSMARTTMFTFSSRLDE